jgi:hypothetical protein
MSLEVFRRQSHEGSSFTLTKGQELTLTYSSPSPPSPPKQIPKDDSCHKIPSRLQAPTTVSLTRAPGANAPAGHVVVGDPPISGPRLDVQPGGVPVDALTGHLAEDAHTGALGQGLDHRAAAVVGAVRAGPAVVCTAGQGSSLQRVIHADQKYEGSLLNLMVVLEVWRDS